MVFLQSIIVFGGSAREVVLFGAAVVVSLLVAVLAWRHRGARGAFSLMGLMLANAVWTGCNVVMLTAPRPFPQIAFYLADIAYFTLMPFLVLFVLEYSGYSGAVTRKRMLGFWAVPDFSTT